MIKFALLLTIFITQLVSIAQAQVKPEPAKDQAILLKSSDPQIAANKQLVYDMYREVLQGGQVSRIPHYFTEGYIQHNPNVATGRAALIGFIEGSRPAVEVVDSIKLPLISITAERDQVVFNFVRTEKDENGETYHSTWFDMFRIEDGKIAEHWDPALKSADAKKMNPNATQMLDDK